MAELDPADEQILKSALDRPFEPADVPIKSAVPPSMNSNTIVAPTANVSSAASTEPVTSSESAEEDPWKAEFEAQVEEWRAKSAEARERAEHERVKWEAIRKQEEEERQALGQEPETWESLGSHITTSIAAASEVLAGSTPSLVSTPSRAEGVETVVSKRPESTSHFTRPSAGVSPYQQMVNDPSSPESYPSLSLSDPSGLQSPSPRRDPFPAEYPPSPPQKAAEAKTTGPPPSTLPSILDGTIKRRTRLSLILSSLAINLLFPFINGVMLGFGEIFAKEVLVGWLGWKLRRGRTTASVGLRQ